MTIRHFIVTPAFIIFYLKACLNGHLPVVEHLLNFQANIEIREKSVGATPLYIGY